MWFGDLRQLVFSDIPNDRLMRWDEETGHVGLFRKPAGHPDGNTRDRQGRLITAELGTRRLTRTELDGRVTVLADHFEGTRLTGGNDVVVKSDGSIWFSDNGAGIRGNYLGDKAPQELPFRVYRHERRHRRDDRGGRRHGAAERARLLAGRNGSMSWIRRRGGRPRMSMTWPRTAGTLSNGRVFFDGTPGFADGSAATPRAISGAASPAGRGRTALPCSRRTGR